MINPDIVRYQEQVEVLRKLVNDVWGQGFDAGLLAGAVFVVVVILVWKITRVR